MVRGRALSDVGTSLIEVVVSIVLILLVLVPTTWFVIEAQHTASSEHLRAEAVNIATRALETAQANADAGMLPTGNATTQVTVAEFGSRQTTFTERTTYTTVTQGTSATICQSSAGVSSQIWQMQATVTWNHMAGAAPIVQTVDIAPGRAGAAQQSEGELAVALTTDGILTDAFTGTPTVTLTGQWEGTGSQPTIPSGEATSRKITSTGDGCVVFQNMDADTGWVYTVSLSGNSNVVTDQEYSDYNPNGAYSVSNIVLTPGVLLTKTITLNYGSVFDIQYTGASGDCSVGPPLLLPLPTSSEVPVSVENSFLSGYPATTWVAYSPVSASVSSLRLFPWSGITEMWAGDQPNSSPTVYGGTNAACSVDDSSSSTTTEFLPLYPLYLKVSGSGSGLAAREVAGGGYSYALNQSLSASATSLPLGEYLLTDSGGSVTAGGQAAYVWVEPSGDCLDTTVDSPPAASSCSGGPGSPLAVSTS